MSRFLLALASLVLVYALILASFDAWDLTVGALVATALLWGSRRFTFGDSIAPVTNLPSRAFWLTPYIAMVAWDVVRGTWNVALIVLHLRPLAHPGLVTVPFEERTRLGVVVSALAMTLSPGSFPVEFDWNKRVMIVHFLDASDPDAIRSEQQRFYRRYQRRVFP